MSEEGALSPRQRSAACALARARTYEDAAGEAGVSVRSLYDWRRDAVFSEEVRRRQDEIYSGARGNVRAGTTEAVRALRCIISDESANTSARVRAALGLLDHAFRLWEYDDLDQRLARLEAEFSE